MTKDYIITIKDADGNFVSAFPASAAEVISLQGQMLKNIEGGASENALPPTVQITRKEPKATSGYKKKEKATVQVQENEEIEAFHQRKNTLDPEVKQKVEDRLKAGEMPSEIALATGVAPQTVYNIKSRLKAAGEL